MPKNHMETREITCPYCDYEYSDSWEYNDRQEEETNDE